MNKGMFNILSHPSVISLKQMLDKGYWDKANTVEFVCFMNKLIIIIPGLLFGVQWWWLYVIAAITSLGLVWSSTVKTLPTIILFNLCWFVLAVTAIVMYFIK